MPRPNILLLHTDQQRFDTIAALGNPHMHAPNMDRLVAMGTSFVNAYSANPVCMPARHDLMTGVSARHHGYYHNQHRPICDYRLETIPRLLTAADYQTIAVGKMHFHPEREHHGFAHMHLMEEVPTCRENDGYLEYLERVGHGDVRCQHGVRPLFYHTPQIARVPEIHHGSSWIATQTIDLIRRDRDRPFFVFASWVGPHPPYYVPASYLDMYRDASLPAPCSAPPGVERHAPISPENPGLGDRRLQRLREGYCGAVSLIDAHIGRILDTLEETGQLENTIILLTADHGEMLGDRGAYQKHVPYEGSAHIPMIACGPGLAEGVREVTPVTTWDAAATILEAAGVQLPEGHPLMGVSLRSEAAHDAERTIVFHHAEEGRRYLAAVGHGHKLIHWFNGGEEELYDLTCDPWEQRNLVQRPASAEIAEHLRHACLAFEHDQGIAANVHDNTFVDLPYADPPAGYCTLYPDWSWRQFPRWMDGYSQPDLALISQEMMDCLQADALNIPKNEDWRAKALAYWVGLGGDPRVYQAIYAEVDARRGQN